MFRLDDVIIIFTTAGESAGTERKGVVYVYMYKMKSFVLLCNPAKGH